MLFQRYYKGLLVKRRQREINKNYHRKNILSDLKRVLDTWVWTGRDFAESNLNVMADFSLWLKSVTYLWFFSYLFTLEKNKTIILSCRNILFDNVLDMKVKDKWCVLKTIWKQVDSRVEISLVMIYSSDEKKTKIPNRLFT